MGKAKLPKWPAIQPKGKWVQGSQTQQRFSQKTARPNKRQVWPILVSKETKYTSIYSIFYVLVGWTQKANTPSEITDCTFVYVKEKQSQYINCSLKHVSGF